METIHLKTVDPVSQDLLRLAANNGIALNWDRYERLQPQDGFLRLGLSCPFGCLQGPCRIDPFGRGADRGLCGLNRDAMVAAMLLQLSLQGTLMLMNEITKTGSAPAVSFAAALEKALLKAKRALGVKTLTIDEIFKSASYLQRPSASFEKILSQSLILSLLAVGLSRTDSRKNKVKNQNLVAGYGVLSGNHVVVALVGRPSNNLIASLYSAANRNSSSSVLLVSLGEWIATANGYLPIVCSSAEAELVLSSHAIHGVAISSGADPGVIEAAYRLNVPVQRLDVEADAVKILNKAQQFQACAPLPEVEFTPQLIGNGMVSENLKGVKKTAKEKSKARLALVGGSDSLYYPLGHLPVELAGSLRDVGMQVIGWGDAAVWMIKSGLASPEIKERAFIMDPSQGPLQIFEEMKPGDSTIQLKGVLFTGSRDSKDIPIALGLAMLGCKVALADTIPCWGSSNVRNLLTEVLKTNGGQLTYFDHPAETEELTKWFTR